MLEQATASLDRIFGADRYTIEKTGEYSALLTTELGAFSFTDDPRDFVAASIIAVPGLDVVQSPIDTWMNFLGEETPIHDRAAPYEEQLASELKTIASIVSNILVDSDCARDAAWFVKGYSWAYNDWASGKGSWAGVD